jgi:hypothetical protein
MNQRAHGFSKHQLEEAVRALSSTLAKCNKALGNLHEGTAQRTLLVRRIEALEIALALLRRELDETCAQTENP